MLYRTVLLYRIICVFYSKYSVFSDDFFNTLLRRFVIFVFSFSKTGEAESWTEGWMAENQTVRTNKHTDTDTPGEAGCLRTAALLCGSAYLAAVVWGRNQPVAPSQRQTRLTVRSCFQVHEDGVCAVAVSWTQLRVKSLRRQTALWRTELLYFEGEPLPAVPRDPAQIRGSVMSCDKLFQLSLVGLYTGSKQTAHRGTHAGTCGAELLRLTPRGTRTRVHQSTLPAQCAFTQHIKVNTHTQHTLCSRMENKPGSLWPLHVHIAPACWGIFLYIKVIFINFS